MTQQVTQQIWENSIRSMPNDEEAERAVLGGILIDNRLMPSVAESMDVDAIYYPLHRRIYTAMLALFMAGQPMDPILIGDELKKDGPIDAIGGVRRITQLSHGIPAFTDVSKYVQIVNDKSKLRELINLCSEIGNKAFLAAESTSEIIDYAEQKVFSLASVKENSAPTRVNVLFDESIAKTEKIMRDGVDTSGIKSGLKDLDYLTGGWKPGDLIIIAARPSMGKTALAVQCALQGIQNERVGLIFSLEMSKEQLMGRMIASESQINIASYMSGQLYGSNFDDAKGTWPRFRGKNLYIDNPSSLTPMQLLAKSRRLAAEHKRLDLIVVDYLQLMTTSSKTPSRYEAVSQISRELKMIAMDLNVPVIALSQLSRGPESRNPPIPQMSDLRESGAIEQDADMVLMIYREDYYKKNSENAGVAELILAKHRNGPTGTVKTTFIKEYTKFENYYAGV